MSLQSVWQALEEKLFENNYKCEDYGRDSGYCNYCTENAFDKSNDKEMSEMSSKECLVRWRKKKSGKKGGKLPPTAPKNNGKCNQLMGMFVHFLLALTNETGAQTTTESLHFWE